MRARQHMLYISTWLCWPSAFYSYIVVGICVHDACLAAHDLHRRLTLLAICIIFLRRRGNLFSRCVLQEKFDMSVWLCWPSAFHSYIVVKICVHDACSAAHASHRRLDLLAICILFIHRRRTLHSRCMLGSACFTGALGFVGHLHSFIHRG